MKAAGTARRVLAAEETAGKEWGRQGSVSVLLSDPRALAFAFSNIILFPFCYVSIVCWRNDAIKSTESGGKMLWYEGMCMCVCMSSIKKQTHTNPLHIWQLPLICVLPAREKSISKYFWQLTSFICIDVVQSVGCCSRAVVDHHCDS